jgi:hypothetical protein
LPEEGAGKHPLAGLKGFDIRLGDRPIIDLLLDRLRAAEAFDPIYLAGPTSVYGESHQGARVIDTDGTFGENITASIKEVTKEHPSGSLAFITCDVLPDLEELRRLLGDYQEHSPLTFWFALILAPADPERLGASSWKPQYRIRQEGSQQASRILPGHLVIMEPSRFRLDVATRAVELSYESRNRPIAYRLFYIASRIILFLLSLDLKRLFRLRPPTLTVSLLSNAVLLAWKLRQGTITNTELAERLRRIFVKRNRKRPDRCRVALMDAMTLARDIDTEEEAAEKARELGIE